MTSTQHWLATALPSIITLTTLAITLFRIFGIREDIRETRADIKMLTGKVYEMMSK